MSTRGTMLPVKEPAAMTVPELTVEYAKWLTKCARGERWSVAQLERHAHVCEEMRRRRVL